MPVKLELPENKEDRYPVTVLVRLIRELPAAYSLALEINQQSEADSLVLTQQEVSEAQDCRTYLQRNLGSQSFSELEELSNLHTNGSTQLRTNSQKALACIIETYKAMFPEDFTSNTKNEAYNNLVIALKLRDVHPEYNDFAQKIGMLVLTSLGLASDTPSPLSTSPQQLLTNFVANNMHLPENIEAKLSSYRTCRDTYIKLANDMIANMRAAQASSSSSSATRAPKRQHHQTSEAPAGHAPGTNPAANTSTTSSSSTSERRRSTYIPSKTARMSATNTTSTRSESPQDGTSATSSSSTSERRRSTYIPSKQIRLHTTKQPSSDNTTTDTASSSQSQKEDAPTTTYQPQL